MSESNPPRGFGHLSGFLKDEDTKKLTDLYRYARRRHRDFDTKYYGDLADVIYNILLRRGVQV